MAAAMSPASMAANGQTPARRLLSVRELAELLGVSADYVYRHSTALGALRLPARDGGRGRLRFHWPTTAALLASVRSASERSQPVESPGRKW
jgi:predicted DNA-binding transcriptional regulator YafY